MSVGEVLEDIRRMCLEDLETVRECVAECIDRQKRLQDTPSRVDRMIEEYQASLGRAGGDPWVQPSSPLDSWPLGAVVTHEGHLWESEKHLNMSEPGVDGWQKVEEEHDEYEVES